MKHLALAILLSLVTQSLSAGDWPAFRGPNGDGISTEKNVPTEWSKDKNIKWKVALPGDGNSSPIVSNGKVFVTCSANRGGTRSLYCLDRLDGKQLWVKSVAFEAGEVTHQTNPYCGSTPVADGKRVVVWHGTAGVFCYDFEGKEIWNADLGAVTHIWGYGSSPILYDGKVILNYGPGKQTFVVALNLEDGSIAWKTEEVGGSDDRKGRMVGSWSTPSVLKIDGADQIICSMPKRVVAYSPADGSILWTVDGLPSARGDLVYTSVISSGDFAVAMGGYKGPAMGFKLGGKGDVTQQNRLWREEQGQPQRIGSGVIIGEHIYMANAGPGTFQCIELLTGKTVWNERMKGDNWGSIVLVEGRLFVTNQDGVTRVVEPSPEKMTVVAENDIGESSNATPAFSDSEIFLRTSKSIYCVSATK